MENEERKAVRYETTKSKQTFARGTKLAGRHPEKATRQPRDSGPADLVLPLD
jgi:hypothetical protein